MFSYLLKKKKPLPDTVVKVIKPLFDHLGKKEFLVSVEKCRTQNVNESFHHIVWQYAPKDKLNSVNKINLAPHLAVLISTKDMVCQSVQCPNPLEFSFLKIC